MARKNPLFIRKFQKSQTIPISKAGREITSATIIKLSVIFFTSNFFDLKPGNYIFESRKKLMVTTTLMAMAFLRYNCCKNNVEKFEKNK